MTLHRWSRTATDYRRNRGLSSSPPSLVPSQASEHMVTLLPYTYGHFHTKPRGLLTPNPWVWPYVYGHKVYGHFRTLQLAQRYANRDVTLYVWSRSVW